MARSFVTLSLGLVFACSRAEDAPEEPPAPLAALSLDGDSAIAIVRAPRHSRGRSLLGDGSVVRVDLSTGARTELYRSPDPCSLAVAGGFIHWADGENGDPSMGPSHRAPLTGNAVVEPTGTRVRCGNSLAVDREGTLWWMEPGPAGTDGSPTSLQRWRPGDGAASVVVDLAKLARRYSDSAIAANTRYVAMGLRDRLVVVGKDGTGMFEIGPVNHADPADDVGRHVEWVGISETTAFWSTRDDHRFRLFSAPIAARATPYEHTDIFTSRAIEATPALAGEEVFVCATPVGNNRDLPLRVRRGLPFEPLSTEPCDLIAADTKRVAWRTANGTFATAAR